MVLSPRVRAARSVVAQQATVIPNPLGEAIAASSERLVDMMIQNWRLDIQEERLGLERERTQLQRQRTESLAQRRNFMKRMDQLDMMVGMAEPGEPLGNQSAVLRQGFSEVFGVDVDENPELANLVVNPLDMDDKLTKLKFDTIDRLRTLADKGETEEIRQQARNDANLLQERLLLEGESLAEARENQTAARVGTRAFKQLDALADRVASGEADPQEARLWRNFIAAKTETPFRIEVPTPSGGTMVVDQPVASTLVSQLWQTAREGMADNEERIASMSTSLVDALDPEFAIDERLARNVVTAAMQGDTGRLEELAGRGPGARAAVQVTLQGKTKAEGMSQIYLDYLDRLDPRLGQMARLSLGSARLMRDSGMPREEVTEQAKSMTDVLKNMAEDIEGVEPEDIPGFQSAAAWRDISIGAVGGAGGGFAVGNVPGAIGGGLLGGVLGAARGRDPSPSGADAAMQQQGTPTVEDLMRQGRIGGEGGEGGETPQLQAGDEDLAGIAADIMAGETSFRQAINDHNLNRRQALLLRQVLRGSEEEEQ